MPGLDIINLNKTKLHINNNIPPKRNIRENNSFIFCNKVPIIGIKFKKLNSERKNRKCCKNNKALLQFAVTANKRKNNRKYNTASFFEGYISNNCIKWLNCNLHQAKIGFIIIHI